MKKILLTFASMLSCLFAVNAQQRTVLYEEFTGENCGPCAAYNPGLEALMAAGTNPTKIIHVTFMEPVPSSGNFYTSVQALNDSRYGCTGGPSGYYNPLWVAGGGGCFTPSGMMDGFFPDSTSSSSCGNCGNIHSLTQTDIDNEAAIASPFTISAYHRFNAAHDSVFGKVIVKAVSAIGGNSLKLRAVFVRTMNFATPPGTNGESHFENVARVMYPSETGQSIATSWPVGQQIVYSYSGKCAHLDALPGVTTADSNFVVYIQNDTAGAAPAANRFRVLQAAKSTYVSTLPLETEPIANTIETSLNIYPNHAKESATLTFYTEHESAVSVKVVDELGRTVYSVPAENMAAGTQRITISTNNLPVGIYSVILQADGQVMARKLSVGK